MMVRVLAPLSVILAAFVAGLLLIPVALPVVGQLVDWSWPVIHRWTPTVVLRDGDDLVISGTMVKSRPCTYVPPARARFGDGRNVAVRSGSPTALLTWADDDLPQAFGPWRIAGGAGQHVTLYLHHRCTALWDTITEIGEINDMGGRP